MAAKIGSPALTRKEMVGIGVLTGVSSQVAGQQTNYTINKARSTKTRVKNAYYKRKLRNGKTIKVRKVTNHGVGNNQSYGGGY